VFPVRYELFVYYLELRVLDFICIQKKIMIVYAGF
jgi:hypothetical protein